MKGADDLVDFSLALEDAVEYMAFQTSLNWREVTMNQLQTGHKRKRTSIAAS
jgi:hypothetical protein